MSLVSSNYMKFEASSTFLSGDGARKIFEGGNPSKIKEKIHRVMYFETQKSSSRYCFWMPVFNLTFLSFLKISYHPTPSIHNN